MPCRPSLSMSLRICAAHEVLFMQVNVLFSGVNLVHTHSTTTTVNIPVTEQLMVTASSHTFILWPIMISRYSTADKRYTHV